jgi:hypothetical protein
MIGKLNYCSSISTNKITEVNKELNNKNIYLNKSVIMMNFVINVK